MPELIDVLEECIELVAGEEYLIDEVVMSKKHVKSYVHELQESLNLLLWKIESDFPDIDKFTYRRLIFPTEITPDEEGMIIYNKETWEVMKSSEYKHNGYEVFLKREK